MCFKNGDKYCWTKAYYDLANPLGTFWEPCAPNGAVTLVSYGNDPIDADAVGWVIQSLDNASPCANSAYWNSEDIHGACQGLYQAAESDFATEGSDWALG